MCDVGEFFDGDRDGPAEVCVGHSSRGVGECVGLYDAERGDVREKFPAPLAEPVGGAVGCPGGGQNTTDRIDGH
jgi:hypothetical protein